MPIAGTSALGAGAAAAAAIVKPSNTDDERAYEVVQKYAMYAAGAGLIPVPLIDFAAIGALELKMVAELAGVYGVPFERDRVRPILLSLIGAYASTKLGYGAGGAFLKSVPVIGPLLGVAAMPGFAAGLTWAVGRVFIQHFASGGTFLNFNPEEVRAFFARKAAAV